jgi:hypothetical protein
MRNMLRNFRTEPLIWSQRYPRWYLPFAHSELFGKETGGNEGLTGKELYDKIKAQVEEGDDGGDAHFPNVDESRLSLKDLQARDRGERVTDKDTNKPPGK